MAMNDELFSTEEIDELRREMEKMAMMGNVKETKKTEPKAGLGADRAMLGDIEEKTSLAPLGIEENGSYIRLSDDHMTAWMYLAAPGEGKDNYTMKEFTGFLAKKGVIRGYHKSNLAAMIKKRVYEREIVVAQGQPAIDGKNGYYEYKFDPDQHRAPKVLENGKVDYTNMSTLQNVHEGDVVAIYHQAMQGQDGYDIMGKPLKAKRVREASPLRGQVVCKEDDPDVYLAQKDGKIEIKNGKIDIQEVHEVSGDLTLITGKVEFYGDIVITGNVESGVVIRAGRNVEVKGTVEAATIFAGGDIILSRGIQGAQRAKVSARGNVFADFIEHTVLVAGGNVQANIILNSRVSADGQVILTGKKGAIVGGYTHGMLGVVATEVGNPAEIRTVIHAGCEKEIYQKMHSAKSAESSQEEELKEIVQELKDIQRKIKTLGGKVPARLEARVKELEPKVNVLRNELAESRQVRTEMENLIAVGQEAEIVVNGSIHRGTVLGLSQAQMPIERGTCLMKYFYQNGLVESSVIAYS